MNDNQDLDNFNPVARIVVIGVGGAGNNAVNRMIDEEISNVEFWVFNTDKQALSLSKAKNRLCIGTNATGGLGAGGNPAMGRKAAEESKEDIEGIVSGADMVFIAAGMGGGTGTGAAPVIASIARNAGALTLAIVTRPFGFEGERRIANSVEGLSNLMDACDSVIVVSNDQLLQREGNAPMGQAFSISDEVLARSVQTVTDIILLPALINADFQDVKATLLGAGIALIGFGTGHGAKKAFEAAENAVKNPLLEADITGAKKAICAVTCSNDVTLYEAQDCVCHVKDLAGGDIDMKFGVSINNMLEDTINVSVIAAGFPDGGKDLLKPIEPGMVRRIEPLAPEEKVEEKQGSGADAILGSILPGFIEED